MLDLIHNEIKLLIKSKLTIIFMLLPVAFSLFGMNAIDHSNAMRLHGIAKTSYTMALGIVQYGAIAGTALFGVFTIMVFNKDKRKDSKILLDSNIDYYKVLFARMIVIVVLALLTVFMSMVFEYLIQVFVLRISYDMGIYIFSYGVIMLPSLMFSIFICGGLYLISDSIDISFLVFGGLFIYGLNASSYLMRWVQAHGEVYSDFGGITILKDTMIYNRILWTFISLGILILGVLLRRRYELSVWKGFRWNVRKVYMPMALIIAILSSGFIYAQEPYVNPKDSVWNVDIPVDEQVNLWAIDSDITLYPQEQKLSAKVKYNFKKSQNVEYIDFITNIGLQIEKITVNGEEGTFKYKEDSDIIAVNVPQDEEINIEITYKGKIKRPSAEAVAGYITKDSIYLLENSHWIFKPLTYNVKETKISGRITAPRYLRVVPVGEITHITEQNDNKTWEYETISSNVDIGVFAGNYEVENMNVEGIDIEVYYAPSHKKYIDETKILSYIEDITRYYRGILGEYAFTEIPLKIVEVPMYKTGGHSTMNVVTIAEYMFNRKELEGNPRENYTLQHDIEIIAHEIAHQWWGTGVAVEMDAPWSSEGLATYTAYKYVEKEFESWLAKSTIYSWQYAVRKAENSYYREESFKEHLNPKLKQKMEAEQTHALLYCEMPLILLEMEQSKGEREFLSLLSKVYQKYLNKTISYEDFIKEVGGNMEHKGWRYE